MVYAFVASLASAAYADPQVDRPAAEKLFDEGRQLLAANRPDEACAKFEQSIKKDSRAVGTLLNLALCNERQGKTATALGLYQEALDRASEAQDQAQQKAAQDKVLVLSPQVPIAVLGFEAPPISGSKLVIDDKIVAVEVHELPIDPGHHELVLTAPGRLPYELTFEVIRGERREVKLPALQLPATKIVIRGGGPRFYGKLVLYGGAGLVAVAGGFAFWGWHTYRAQFPDHCGPPTHPDFAGQTTCDASGQHATERARLDGTVATVVGGIGLVALIAGSILVWQAPSPEHHVVVSATGTATGVGFGVTGSF